MDQAKLSRELSAWLQEKVFSSGGKGAVFGLSGGLDSAVVAALCQKAFAGQCTGLIMPCYNQELDREHAELVARTLGLTYEIIVLDGVFEQMLLALEGKNADKKKIGLAAANIKPRLRMAVLYYYAAGRGYRVIGTGNKSEIAIGYFTKYGDGGVDLEPLGDLLKEEVRELAAFLGIPREIIDKKPTAGLWAGQSDEEEMGFSYRELDRFLRGESVEPAIRVKIETMRRNSEHKRQMPPVFLRRP